MRGDLCRCFFRECGKKIIYSKLAFIPLTPIQNSSIIFIRKPNESLLKVFGNFLVIKVNYNAEINYYRHKKLLKLTKIGELVLFG